MNQDNTEQDSINKAAETYYANFAKSFLEELNSGIYFQTEWPEEEGKRREGNPIDDNHLILDTQALEELNSDYEYVSLFEAALIIGSRVNPTTPSCLVHEWKMFADAALTGDIDPRNPVTYIPYSKDCGKFVKENDGEITATNRVIDMSWCLSLDEVAKFAILNDYDAELFNDLLSDVSADQKPDIKGEEPLNESVEDTKAEQPLNEPVEDIKAEESLNERVTDAKPQRPLDTREKNTLLTIIYALCENQGITPNDRGLAKKLESIADKLGGKASESTIKRHLKNAFDLLGK